MSIVVNVTPNLAFRPQWLVAEIDFDYELSKQAADESHGDGMRSGASRDFEAEMQWAVNEFVERMEQRGHIFFARAGSPVIKGPFLPYDYSNDWPRGDCDGEELPRKRERSIEETGGRVCYRIAAPFLVREHIRREIVEQDSVPEEEWQAIKNAKKENGLWVSQPKKRQHFEVSNGD